MILKKRYIIILLLIIFISIAGFILKSKNIEISNVSNKNDKLIYNFTQNEDFPDCDQWINIGDIDANDKIYSNTNFIVIDASKTNLESADGPTGYQDFAFIKSNGCNADVSEITLNNEVLGELKDYVENDRPIIDASFSNLKYWKEQFNEIVDQCGSCTIDKFEILDETHTCTQELDEAGWPALRYDGYVAYGWSDAPYSSESDWVNFYIDECGCQDNYKYYIKTSESRNTLQEKCSSVLNETGYHTHSINGQNFCYQNGLLKHTGECTLECTDDIKNEIISTNDVVKAQTFNNVCTELDPIPMSTITMNWNGGWGPSTLGENWGGENGVYTITGIVGNKHTIEFDADLIYYNHNVEGWSRNQTCTSYDTSIENPTSKNPVFTFESSNVTYYACYEGGLFEESLFNDDLTKKTGTTYKVYEDNVCTDDEIISNNLTTVPMKSVSRYVKESYDTIRTEEVLGQDNIYCNVLCVDTIDVYYPNIFETIPAGQYFELMYEPEIKASRTCQSEFRYNGETGWKKAYENAIKEEKDAMDALNLAQANLDAAENLSTTGTQGTCCSYGTCFGEGCTPTCLAYNYSDSETEKYYHQLYSNKIDGDTQSASGCGSSNYAISRRSTINSADAVLNTGYTDAYGNIIKSAKQRYYDAVTNRIRLEQFNLQCYTILDQESVGTSSKSNPTNIKYDTVFKQNYTYKDNVKNEVILDLNNSLEYEINTPFVTPPTSNNSTLSSYVSYVTSKTGYSAGITGLYATSIKNVGSTANFFSTYPSLTLKYDDGSEGKPTALNQEQILDVEAHVKQDTGSYTHINAAGAYEKNINRDTIDEDYTKFYYEGTKAKYIDFSPYTATKTKRTVNYYFTYHEAQEYISEIQSGIVKQKSEAILNNYIDLYNKQIVTLNESAVQKNIYNNVLPVALKAINSKNYEIKLELSDKDRTTFLNGSTEYNTYLQLTANNTFNLNGFTGNYTCQYEITNDALTLSDKTSEDYKKLKSNTIFRSVATENIDPNNRGNYGNLGENWTNDKGQAVQESMIKIETNNETATNDTYNPKNLEYSFTLTPAIIKAIKSTSVPAGYNAGNNYDDFNLTCAKDDGRDLGRECTSEFLTELSEGKVDGVEVQQNYSNINSWGLTDLTNIRKKWKYYNGITGKIEIKTATVDMNGNIATPAMGLEEYLAKYEKWGVRP